MVPDKFNMVDMDGIDLIMAQGEEVPGLYNRLVESIAQCRYQCLYNWFFDGVVIPPSYVKMEVNEDEEVAINEGITVSADDVIHIYSLGPSPVDPEIIPLLAEENGVYNVPSGKDGFNPVTVDVPSYTPVIDPIIITENGTYNVPAGIDGYGPITVNVEGAGMNFTKIFESVGATSGTISEAYTSFKGLLLVIRQGGDNKVKMSAVFPNEVIASGIPIGGCIVQTTYCYVTFNSTTTFVNSITNGCSITEIYGIN